MSKAFDSLNHNLMLEKLRKLCLKASVTSCSSVWWNTSKRNVHKLQLVQNFAARVVLGLRKFDHSLSLRDGDLLNG